MARCSKCNQIIAEDAICSICYSKGGIYRSGNEYRCCYCHRSISEVCDGKHKNWLTTLLLAIFLGWIGIHRFYVRKWKTGLIMILLCWIGIFGRWAIGISISWAIIDIIRIAIGKFEDGEGRVVKKYS